jgi:dTDP-glucose 4,6-dehydratase
MLKQLLTDAGNFVYCPVTYRHGGREDRIANLIPDRSISNHKIFEADLAYKKLDFDDLEIDCIINFASESHVDNSILRPSELVSNNVNLLINILESLKASRRLIPFLHISTDEVYGEVVRGQEKREWNSILLPSNPYSASKAMQEDLIVAYQRTFGIVACLFNITNMIGEAQNPEKFLPRAISRVLTGQEINIDTNLSGEIGSRKYLYVGDVAKAISMVLSHILEGRISLDNGVEKFHISGSFEYSNLDIINFVGQYLDRAPRITVSPSPRRGYDLRYDLNSQKLRDLGWEESRGVPETIKETVKWTVNRPHWLEK